MSRSYQIFTFVMTLLLFQLVSATVFALVTLENKAGQVLPLDKITVKDEAGISHGLADFFHTGLPVVMLPIYYGCPGACTVVLNNMVDMLKKSPLTPGTSFEFVVFSIDSNENSKIATEKKASYLKLYGKADSSIHWHFLTLTQPELMKLTDALGFHFEKDLASQTFSHPSALYFLKKDGAIASVLQGVTFKPKVFRTALASVTTKRVGWVEKLQAFCALSLKNDSTVAPASLGWIWPTGIAFTLLMSLSLLWRSGSFNFNSFKTKG